MRFVLVHSTEVGSAAQLLRKLGVLDDPQTALLRFGNEPYPIGKNAETLYEHQGAELGFIRARPEFRKAALELSNGREVFSKWTVHEAKESLEQWFGVSTAKPPLDRQPSVAFREAAQGEPRLVIAVSALDQADMIAPIRIEFANKAARALATYAHDGRTRMSLKNYFSEMCGLQFAANTRDYATYTIYDAGGFPLGSGRTEYHLKAGDHTTRANAARVYFETSTDMEEPKDARLRREFFVFVLRCGPHPDGPFAAIVRLP